MKQYVIIAQDGRDPEALERRMDNRPSHLEGARRLKALGAYLAGGAILDDEGKMRGSIMILQFASDAGLQEWMAHEPYILNGVWKDIEVKPFRMADV